MKEKLGCCQFFRHCMCIFISGCGFCSGYLFPLQAGWGYGWVWKDDGWDGKTWGISGKWLLSRLLKLQTVIDYVRLMQIESKDRCQIKKKWKKFILWLWKCMLIFDYSHFHRESIRQYYLFFHWFLIHIMAKNIYLLSQRCTVTDTCNHFGSAKDKCSNTVLHEIKTFTNKTWL